MSAMQQALLINNIAIGTTPVLTSDLAGSISNSGRTFYWVGTASSTFYSAWSRTTVARTGKRYWEVAVNGNTNTNGYVIGIMAQSNWNGSQLVYSGNPFSDPMYGMTNINYFGGVIGLMTNGTNISDATYNFTAGDVIGIACDFDTGKIWYSKNGIWLSGNPDTGVGQTHNIPNGLFDPYMSVYGRNLNGYQYTANFLPSDFAYSLPLGFSRLINP